MVRGAWDGAVFLLELWDWYDGSLSILCIETDYFTYFTGTLDEGIFLQFEMSTREANCSSFGMG